VHWDKHFLRKAVVESPRKRAFGFLRFAQSMHGSEGPPRSNAAATRQMHTIKKGKLKDSRRGETSPEPSYSPVK
jgi:hypothetical protein